jgi:transposase
MNEERSDADLLRDIRRAAAANRRLRTLVVDAVTRGSIPVRDIAAAAGVSPQTPLNWAAHSGREGAQVE